MRFPRPFAAALFAAALLASVAPSAHAAPVYAPPVPLVTVYNTPVSSSSATGPGAPIVRCTPPAWCGAAPRSGPPRWSGSEPPTRR
ncbi:hypothetical protein G7085_01000 [Tessaracoccus sp. HDW20]|uniref:hypothetical protein n=1 Tax=Tessaracoccus coleopterorum TaxID=2714950 RepID=UPI0018D29353|nr:hypothetical protein [Tessaracoccus coleopterorum]NHB83758.1 hypothetical protein [Tessaracoccus coleopterorum]